MGTGTHAVGPQQSKTHIIIIIIIITYITRRDVRIHDRMRRRAIISSASPLRCRGAAADRSRVHYDIHQRREAAR